MNGKKGSHSIEINIPCSVTKVKQHESSKGEGGGEGGGFSLKAWVRNVWEFAREDSNRVKFSLKVGLAVLLVSLLILFRAPYEVFGTNIIWSILTVAIMFEYTVGATLTEDLTELLGVCLPRVLAISVAQVALSSGRVAEPIIIGFSIFIIGTITSFMKLWPSLVPYEYGFRVVLFTYCLIVVSGYRLSMGNPMRTAMDRLYSIAIGGFVAVLVNVLVCPIWAGEQLHKELVNNFNSFPDEPAYRKCKKNTLNSSAKLEALIAYVPSLRDQVTRRSLVFGICLDLMPCAVLAHAGEDFEPLEHNVALCHLNLGAALCPLTFVVVSFHLSLVTASCALTLDTASCHLRFCPDFVPLDKI
ncbi:aluminum-activated malate transporter 4-like [Pyrus ussuriensis x Pyrus communis]|uniref:Aluminum-activated malate transporter 4-like n=1 Tax=Pyrus ussuriensis x Pyrus communis TaxID=2448454 RepID=A0A5N5G0U4_9ROSA|nr:aluminum-activated malate transporter 4-like [Pyrus ussuriensis x Pyrus communis]